jgi:acyl-ACP thioesterase
VVAGDELVPRPPRGRVFTGSARVRLADLSRSGRLRLDAIARFMQDVASDDAADAGARPDRAWVLRRLGLELHDDRAARMRDDLTLDTWCSGVGRAWAERRTDLAFGSTIVARAAAVWVLIDVTTGRPTPLGPDFDAAFGEASGGRKIGQRLSLPSPPSDGERSRWPVRVTDFDLVGHVNNAAYWAAAEEALAALEPRRGARRAEIEFRAGIDPGELVEVVQVAGGDALRLWLTVDGDVRASMLLDLAPGDPPARRF